MAWDREHTRLACITRDEPFPLLLTPVPCVPQVVLYVRDGNGNLWGPKGKPHIHMHLEVSPP
jgi:hypothetical protein